MEVSNEKLCSGLYSLVVLSSAGLVVKNNSVFACAKIMNAKFFIFFARLIWCIYVEEKGC